MDATAVKSRQKKSDRLGWESYSTRSAVEVKRAIGNGYKVEKNAYCNPAVNYRQLVP